MKTDGRMGRCVTGACRAAELGGRPSRAGWACAVVGALALILSPSLTHAGDAAPSIGTVVSVAETLGPRDPFMGVRLLGMVRLARSSPDGETIAGLSGLAWDADQDRLYAVSDFGELFHLAPVIEDGVLVDVALLDRVPLRGASGRPLEGTWSDAEGLAAVHADNGRDGDTELWVAFERRPRVWRYRPDGRVIGPLALPPDLTEATAYSDPNKALESIAMRGTQGWLCAPERPLAGIEDEWVPLVADDGRRWRYPLSGEPNGSVTALEALPDDGVLVLERSFVSVFRPLVIHLRRTSLDGPGDDEPLAVEDVAVFDNGAGWQVDNFEGLAHHRDGRYFLVSDDNANGYQRTLLLYLELLDR